MQRYLIHAKLNPYKSKVLKSLEVTKECIRKSKRPLLSFSGGKDSIVLLDIAIKAGFKGELVFFKYGICTDKETPEETLSTVKYYAEKYNLNLNIVNCLGEFDCWNELGYFCIFPETVEEKRVFNKTNKDFARKSLEFERSYNCDLSIIGMRKAESKARRIMLSKKGNFYTTKTRDSATCCPISNFSDDDVWAYIFNNDLRYPSFYDYKHGDRGKIRNEPTLLYNDSIIRHGEHLMFKTIFSDYMNEIEKIYNIRW